jgi:germination protein M
MAVRKRNDKRSGSNAGTVFWLAAIVIVLFIFMLNWGKIQETLANTHFTEIVKTQTGADKTPLSVAPQVNSPKTDAKLPAAETPQAAAPEAAGPRSTAGEPPSASAPKASGSPSAPTSMKPATPENSPAPPTKDSTPPKVATSSQPVRSRSASLFFVRIDDDGVIVRQEVKRQVPVSDSPLLDSLAALLKGPSEDEIRKKLISLIPQGTMLLSAQVRGSTAYLNFNEAFMYNHYGIEGYAGQLKQIVYTATSFPTVQDVQVLIEGKKHDYLGGEGVYIGRPLSRNSF